MKNLKRVVILKIRELELTDIEEVIQLKEKFKEDQKVRNTLGENANVRPIRDDYKEYEEYFTTNKKKKIFVAVKDGAIIGMIKVIIRKDDPSFEFGENAHVCDLFVLEGHRSYRVCIELYLHCKEWIKSQGCRYITAYTFGFNESIRKSMHILGMKEYKIMYARDIND